MCMQARLPLNTFKVNATFAIRNDGWNELTSSSTLSVTLALNQTVRVSISTCLLINRASGAVDSQSSSRGHNRTRAELHPLLAATFVTHSVQLMMLIALKRPRRPQASTHCRTRCSTAKASHSRICSTQWPCLCCDRFARQHMQVLPWCQWPVAPCSGLSLSTASWVSGLCVACSASKLLVVGSIEAAATLSSSSATGSGGVGHKVAER